MDGVNAEARDEEGAQGEARESAPGVGGHTEACRIAWDNILAAENRHRNRRNSGGGVGLASGSVAARSRQRYRIAAEERGYLEVSGRKTLPIHGEKIVSSAIAARSYRRQNVAEEEWGYTSGFLSIHLYPQTARK